MTLASAGWVASLGYLVAYFGFSPPAPDAGRAVAESIAGRAEPSARMRLEALGPTGVLQRGPVRPALAQIEDGSWLARELGAHPSSTFQVKAIERRDGSTGVLLVRQRVHGIAIAGARLALRFDSRGRLRQVVGRALRAGVDAQAPLPPAPSRVPARAVWWPGRSGLELARMELTPLVWEHGHPQQFERVVRERDGLELARWSTIDHGPEPIRSWRENPLTTPNTELFTTPLDDQSPLRLENGFVRTWDCDWDPDAETCAPRFFPESLPGVGFVDEPPLVSDVAAHRDPQDPFAAPAFTQWGMRFYDRLLDWGWDPYVWDLLDCSWQEVPEDECRVLARVNVLAQDEEGVFPFSGAFYSTGSGIWMGQGINADTAYDGDIVVHEFGHHVTRGYGVPEATGKARDRSRRYVDRSAINEGTSDLFARQIGLNDRIYDYYAAVEPSIYNDNRIRDVGIPFRCPDNLVGETHMDGRIWVSTIRAAQVELAAAGLATEDEFMATFLVALAAIRMIPREDVEQIPEAAQILLDEIRLAHGAQAESVARSIFDARGLRICRRTLDLHDDPSVLGTADPDDPLDDRFMVFTSHSASTDPAKIDSRPWPPPLHHEVTLGDDEDTIRLRFVPGLWRPARPDEELPPFTLGLLVSKSDDEISFWWDDETSAVTNDAQMRFESGPIDDDGFAEVVATGLEPGAHYALALVTLTGVSGERFVIEEMQWSLSMEDDGGSGGATSDDEGSTGDDADSTGGDESSTGDDEGDSGDSGDAGSESEASTSSTDTNATGHGNAGRQNEGGDVIDTGCACTAGQRRGGAPWAWGLLFAGLALRRRSARARDG